MGARQPPRNPAVSSSSPRKPELPRESHPRAAPRRPTTPRARERRAPRVGGVRRLHGEPHRLRGLLGLGVACGGPVAHACRPFGGVAISPLLRCLERRHESRRGSRWRPTVIDNQTGHLQPCTWRQSGIGMGSVGHEGLRVVKRFLRQLHFTSGGLHPSRDSDRVVTRSRPTCLGITTIRARGLRRPRCRRPLAG